MDLILWSERSKKDNENLIIANVSLSSEFSI